VEPGFDRSRCGLSDISLMGVMHPAFFTFPFTFFLLLQDSLKTSDKRYKTTFVIRSIRSGTKVTQADYRTTWHCSHPNPTRRYRQNPWAHCPSSPTPPYDSLEGLDPSSPERRGDEEPRLANTLGRQRLPGRWDGTRSPMAQQQA